MAVLVTGGAGYIGSHTCLELLEAGRDVVVVDNLANSSRHALDRVMRLAGRPLAFYEGDIRDGQLLDRIFEENDIEAVIHFAGLKAVAESFKIPLEYYHTNVCGSVSLLEAMKRHGVQKLIFSSSATVYGMPDHSPVDEEAPRRALNPYGRTKLIIEYMLEDLYQSDDTWGIVRLRYFNPVGAHESGLIGESPNGVPNNLMPYMTQVACGKLPELQIYGNDYPTPDGTCIRDYIHVCDLARGHICALEKIEKERGLFTYNLGTGRGTSVLELVAAFEKAAGMVLPKRIAGRRPGDAAVCYADPSKARRELGWTARHDIFRMCADALRWQRNNPEGYPKD